MSFVLDNLEEYLNQISQYARKGNKKKVISLINEMKNFYMVEEDLKPGKKSEPRPKIEKPTVVIGKEIPVVYIPNDKPRKHIFY